MGLYADKLNQRIEATGSGLCVGLDPRPDRISPEFKGDVTAFLRAAVEETLPFASAFKPNFAYFEAMGIPGLRILESLRGWIPDDVPLLLDVKRSDIGETQRYYAKAAFEVWGADAVTLNPWLGFDTVEPFLEFGGKGVYLLCVTSNPGAAEFALRQTGEGEGVAYAFERIQAMAAKALTANSAVDVGLVTGLTNLAPEVIDRIADLPLLVPGLGAQGGDLTSLAATPRQAPNLVNVTRGILYNDPERSMAEKAADYAARIREALSVDVADSAQVADGRDAAPAVAEVM